MERPEYRPEKHVSNIVMESMAGVSHLVLLSEQYGQNGMYFRGYLDGLQYALAVMVNVFQREEDGKQHGNP